MSPVYYLRATLSTVNDSFGLVPDAAGNLYISDSGANRIRFVNGSTGNITTIAGTGVAEYNGDNILASSASLNYPGSICCDDASTSRYQSNSMIIII